MTQAKRTFGAALLALVASVTAWFSRADDAVPTIRPALGPLAASGSFAFATKPKKTRRNVSGIAFTRPGFAFLAFDEGLEGRFAALSEAGYTPDPTAIPLRVGGVEADAEGAASDGTHLYVVGSHSVKRKGGANDDSRLLVRFKLTDDGRVATDAAGAVVPPLTGDLLSVLRGEPAIAPSIGQSLDDGAGLNIEGLTVWRERLWVGFRGPTEDDKAFVLGVDAAAIFEGRNPAPRLDRVTVGERRSVRDLATVDGGLLILAGPDDAPANRDVGYTIVFWDGRTSRTLAALDLSGVTLRTGLDGCDDEDIKPEAIAVTATLPDRYRVLILADGMCDGGPMWFDVPRSR